MVRFVDRELELTYSGAYELNDLGDYMLTADGLDAFIGYMFVNELTPKSFRIYKQGSKVFLRYTLPQAQADGIELVGTLAEIYADLEGTQHYNRNGETSVHAHVYGRTPLYWMAGYAEKPEGQEDPAVILTKRANSDSRQHTYNLPFRNTTPRYKVKLRAVFSETTGESEIPDGRLDFAYDIEPQSES